MNDKTTSSTPSDAAPDSKIECWSCHLPCTLAQRSAADGHCPHCGVEIELAAPDSSAPSIDPWRHHARGEPRTGQVADGMPALRQICLLSSGQGGTCMCCRGGGHRKDWRCSVSYDQGLADVERENRDLRARIAELEAVQPSAAASTDGADALDAARWRKWLPWMRNLNKKPFNLAKEISEIDRAAAAAEKGQQP